MARLFSSTDECGSDGVSLAMGSLNPGRDYDWIVVFRQYINGYRTLDALRLMPPKIIDDPVENSKGDSRKFQLGGDKALRFSAEALSDKPSGLSDCDTLGKTIALATV